MSDFDVFIREPILDVVPKELHSKVEEVFSNANGIVMIVTRQPIKKYIETLREKRYDDDKIVDMVSYKYNIKSRWYIKERYL